MKIQILKDDPRQRLKRGEVYRFKKFKYDSQKAVLYDDRGFNRAMVRFEEVKLVETD